MLEAAAISSPVGASLAVGGKARASAGDRPEPSGRATFATRNCSMITRGDCFFAVIDEDACSFEASHIRERHGLVVKQKVQDRPGHSPSKRGTDWRATAAPGSFCLIVAEFHLAKRRVEAHIREMVQTWRSGPGEEFTCSHCGAAYEVTINRLPTREADQATCQVCHKIMNRWSSTASVVS
jgi:hypothetical protein